MSARRVRQSFTSWGLRPSAARITVPAYAMRDTEREETRLGAVTRAIGRANNLTVCACSNQGTSLHRGQPEANHYEITLGRPARGGGCDVVASLWISIPIEAAR